MDFKERVPFGRTGLMLSWIGLVLGYGVPTAAIVPFTATCWGKLLKPKLMPEGEHSLDPADCYRFVLSHPDVNVCITGPSTAAQMEDNLKALDAGPLDEEEMARIRRIGKHIYDTAPKALIE